MPITYILYFIYNKENLGKRKKKEKKKNLYGIPFFDKLIIYPFFEKSD